VAYGTLASVCGVNFSVSCLDYIVAVFCIILSIIYNVMYPFYVDDNNVLCFGCYSHLTSFSVNCE
jgi:hypothetical protein